jgi:hypothetical protein
VREEARVVELTSLATLLDSAIARWQITGSARIDNRPPKPCTLTIGSDGHWSAVVQQFTLAGAVDLYFKADLGGGEFCGPAAVMRSRADSYPFAMGTELEGAGPLLIVAAGSGQFGIEGDDGFMDGEVVDD